MTTITPNDTAVQTPFDDVRFDEAQLAAASFLARYSGRTLEAYRQDLRGFFQWAADHDVLVLAATRPHIELPASGTYTRTCCERRSSWPPSTPASPCGTCRPQPGTPTPGPRRSTTGAARTSTVTPPTSSSRSLPEADRRSGAYAGGRE